MNSIDIQTIVSERLRFFREENLKNEVIKEASVVSLTSGMKILKMGSYVKMVPILLDGLVKVMRRDAGKEILIYNIYPSESCIVSINCGINQIKSDVYAISEDEGLALLIPSRLIEDWQRKYPSFNKYVMDLYQKRFEDLLSAFNGIVFERLDLRLMKLLESKSQALQTQTVKITHQELADELGTARETISRILKKLESEKKLEINRGTIEIVSPM